MKRAEMLTPPSEPKLVKYAQEMPQEELKQIIGNIEISNKNFIEEIGGIVLVKECEINIEMAIELANKFSIQFGSSKGKKLFTSFQSTILEFSLLLNDIPNKVEMTSLPIELERHAHDICTKITDLMKRWVSKETLSETHINNDIRDIKKSIKLLSQMAKQEISDYTKRTKPLWKSIITNITYYSDTIYIAGLIVYETKSFWENPTGITDAIIKALIILCVAAARNKNLRERFTEIFISMASMITFKIMNFISFGLLSPLKNIYNSITGIWGVKLMMRSLFYLLMFYFYAWISRTYEAVCRGFTLLAGYGISNYFSEIVNRLGAMTFETVSETITYTLNVMGLGFGSMVNITVQSVTDLVHEVMNDVKLLSSKLADNTGSVFGFLYRWIASFQSIFWSTSNVPLNKTFQSMVTFDPTEFTAVGRSAEEAISILKSGSHLSSSEKISAGVELIWPKYVNKAGDQITVFNADGLRFLYPDKTASQVLDDIRATTSQIVSDTFESMGDEQSVLKMGEFFQNALDRARTQSDQSYVESVYGFIYGENIGYTLQQQFYLYSSEFFVLILIFKLLGWILF